MFTHDMLEILVCPACKGQLKADDSVQHLVCEPCGLLYPVRGGIPVMLVEEAERFQTPVFRSEDG